MRGFYVFIGCSIIVSIYFAAKFVCNTRKKRYKKVSRGDEMDMFPLTEDGDDDDDEIFSAEMHR